MLFLYLSVLAAFLTGAIAGRFASVGHKPWRRTAILTTIISGVIYFLIAFKFLADHDVPNY